MVVRAAEGRREGTEHVTFPHEDPQLLQDALALLGQGQTLDAVQARVREQGARRPPDVGVAAEQSLLEQADVDARVRGRARG